MPSSKLRYFQTSELPPGALRQTVEELSRELDRDPAAVRVAVVQAGRQAEESRPEPRPDLDDLDAVRDLTAQDVSILFPEERGGVFRIAFAGLGSTCGLRVSGPREGEIGQAVARLVAGLGLHEVSSPFGPIAAPSANLPFQAALEALLDRIGSLEDFVVESRRLRAGVALAGHEVYLKLLRRFLALLDVDLVMVVAPDRLTELHTASPELDLVLELVTRQDPAWPEPTGATRRRRLALVEHGAEEPSGTVHLIPFAPDHLGDALVPLGEAVEALRKVIERPAGETAGAPSR